MAQAPAYTAVIDGFKSVEGGVHSGLNPSLLAENQLSFAINATCRGGFARQRDAWRKIPLTFPTQTSWYPPAHGGGDLTGAVKRVQFEDTLFQKAHTFISQDGKSQLISGHGGHIFRIDLSDLNYPVDDISIPLDYNNVSARRFWFTQADNYMIIQDDISAPYIYDGANARRSSLVGHEVPCGTALGYAMGRVWTAIGRNYVGGDLIGSDTGVLSFKENDYILTGGAFSVPSQCREITAFEKIANIDTALGDGGLIIFTPDDVFYLNVPFDRTTWKTTEGMPLQRIAVLKYGTLSPDSVVAVNSDLFYRSKDGLRSIRFATRDFSQWANTPISFELDRVMSLDDRELLSDSSGALMNNRLLFTVSPAFNKEHGTWHRGLGVLDFARLNTIGQTEPPVYDGVWTGQKILQVLSLEVNGVDRCFAYTLSPNNQIELWELCLNLFWDDADQDNRVIWEFETGSRDFGTPNEEKKLVTGELWYDCLGGTIDFSVYYRPDQYPGWIAWDSWTETAPYGLDLPPITLEFPMPQYRPRVALHQPADTVDETVGRPFRHGFEFAFRFVVKGPARIKRFIAKAERLPETEFGRFA